MKTTLGLALVAGLGLLIGHGAQAARLDDHAGPHKGTVIEWGEEELHPELVFDAKGGTVTAYIYGDHNDLHKAKLKAIDSKALILSLKTDPPTTIKLDPMPEKGDPKGSSTKFVGKHEVIKKDVKWTGTLAGKVGTKPYSGEFKVK